MIRDANGKLAITPGVWTHLKSSMFSRGVATSIDDWSQPLEDMGVEGLYLNNLADGDLFAEAGTVTNECGKTPRELLDLCREMRKVLEELSSYPTDRGYADGPCLRRGDMDDVKAALAKSEGV